MTVPHLDPAHLAPEMRDAARTSRAWPFVEARKLLARYPDGKPDGAPVLFETGYGPSGTPHIGTFQEVFRTTLVQRAFQTLTGGAPTRLLVFSDDMDGLRKVPGDIENGEALEDFIDHPLCECPDPWGCHPSFAAHNNARLQEFLHRFGFEFEFVASSDRYRSGAFDDALRRVLSAYDAIQSIMLPTLGEERRATYSPVLPISPSSGRVLQVPVEVLDADAGLVAFEDEGQRIEHRVLSGGAKLQWKVDWAMRWVALGVDYEMYGKDLTDSGTLGARIATVLGGRKPDGLIYEMYLDQEGTKISKSKGNGLTMEQWLELGPEKSLEVFLYREPTSAKHLHPGVVPREVDDLMEFRARYPEQSPEKRAANPVWHCYAGDPPPALPVTYSLLLNLIGVLGAEAERDTVWRYLQRVVGELDEGARGELDRLIDGALAFVAQEGEAAERRAPTAAEADGLRRLDEALAALGDGVGAEAIQSEVYRVGKEGGFPSLRDWFRALYETLLGTSAGPRMGTFIAMVGLDTARRLIGEALARGE